MEAVVLDGGIKSALACVRALSRQGVRVTCAAEKSTALALHSRYTKSRFLYRSPLKDSEGFLSDIERALPLSSNPPVLFALSDATTLILSRNRARWEGRALMALPPEVSLETAFNKQSTLELAQSLSIPIPRTRFIAGADDIDAALHSFEKQYPIVVKPVMSASWKEGRGVRGTVTFAQSEEEARRRIEHIVSESGMYPLLEEYVSGGEYGFEALCHRGEVLAYLSHKRLRSLSPTGGAAVLKETIQPPSDILTYSHALIRALSWTGPIMIEWKQDLRNGAYLLIEINGRFWGSLPLALLAGLDFPTRYAELAYGRVEPLRMLQKDEYERGVISRHLLGDLRHLFMVLLKNDPMRAIAYPTRRTALRDFFSPPKTVRPDVFDIRDPLPFVMEAVSHLV